MRRISPVPGKAIRKLPQATVTNIREHIIDRTIYLMGREGTIDVPIRAIAREAGVNIAAVNYYFSSKDQMLAEMAKRFQIGFDEVMTLLENPELPPEERLRRWAGEVMRYLAEYPGVIALMERQLSADPLDPLGKALRSAILRASRELKKTLEQVARTGDGTRLAFKLTLLTSALAGPFPLSPERVPARRKFQGPAQRARFLDMLIEHLRK